MAEPFRTLSLKLEPDPSRTMIRPFGLSYPEGLEDGREARAIEVAKRLLDYPSDKTRELATFLLDAMEPRVRDAEGVFRRRYAELDFTRLGAHPDEMQQMLLGALFSQEYAFESAALFNPSIIVDPSKEPADGETPFILSLRGIGEGHISSVTFRSGTWHADGSVNIDPPGDMAAPPEVVRDIGDGGARLIWCADVDIAETVIFPVQPSQRQGVEDLRMVTFTEDDGTQLVMGTYTAFDGRDARAELLHGIDRRTIEMRPLTGRMAGYKGMALFPRRIGGRYAMLGRQDSERIWLLTSDDLYHWDEGVPILAPRYVWEWIQLGNCGSPIEIDEGWLVLTHGVGPVRSYCIGACLLDKDDPSKVIARTADPLLHPSLEERGGYVPNVVYGCGALVRGRDILLPYAVGDRYSTFAVGTIDDLLGAMSDP